MTTYKGLVNSLQVRSDGWVEVIVQAVHAGNALQHFFIKDLDGVSHCCTSTAGAIGIIARCLTRILPVVIDYEINPEQGNLILDVICASAPIH